MLVCKFMLLLAIASCFELVHMFQSECDTLNLKVYETGVSEEDIETILQLHNGLRQAIMDGKVEGQPRGVNLKYLQWDDALAKSAQQVADSCAFQHQSIRDGRWRLPVGQNLALGLTSQFTINKDWNAMISKWIDENSRYTYRKITPKIQKTGHYTQIVWADSEYIGCGFNSHQYTKDPRFHTEALYVCHYGPRGNMRGRYPYQLAQENKIGSDSSYEY